jgi:hypothetical protein
MKRMASRVLSYLLHAGVMLDLFIDHEDGVDMCRRKFGSFSIEYTAL